MDRATQGNDELIKKRKLLEQREEMERLREENGEDEDENEDQEDENQEPKRGRWDQYLDVRLFFSSFF